MLIFDISIISFHPPPRPLLINTLLVLLFSFLFHSSASSSPLSPLSSLHSHHKPQPTMSSSSSSPAEAVSQIADKIPSPQEAKETAQAAAPAAQSALISQLRALAAGGFGGICAVVVGHPFDLVKVRLQTAERGVYSSAIDVVRKSIARDGMRRGLYAGVSAPLVGVTPMCM